MSNPTIDIQITPNSADSLIKVNGEDISSLIRAVKFTQIAGQLPILELEIINKGPFTYSGEAILRLKELVVTSEGLKLASNVS